VFNITHTPKPGVCKRRRCSRPAVENGLCEKDLAEWRAAGSPAFAEGGTPLTGNNLVTYGTREALAEEKSSAENALSLIREMEITTQAAMDTAGKFLDGVLEARRSIKARMNAALEPLKTAMEQQKLLYQPVDKIYAEAEALLRDRINAKMRADVAAQDAARLAVEAAGGSVDEHTLVLAHGRENVALPVGMGVREVWVYEVQDETKLRRAVALGELVTALQGMEPALPADQANAVLQVLVQALGVDAVAPNDLLTLNTKALGAYAREAKNQASVPGLKVSIQASATAPRRNGGKA